MGTNFKSRSYLVTAVQWNGDKNAVLEVCKYARFYENQAGTICGLDKKDGTDRARLGDWVVKNEKADSIESWIVMTKEEFEKVYEPAR